MHIFDQNKKPFWKKGRLVVTLTLLYFAANLAYTIYQYNQTHGWKNI